MALTVSLGASSCGGSESEAADLFAKRVNIGDGRSMYIECRGEGSPTVLLVSGAGTASDLWHAADQEGAKVYPEVGKFTRVCA